MAITLINTNDPWTRKQWGKALFKETLHDPEFSQLIGTSSESPVQIKVELEKTGNGDEIKFDIVKALTGEGRVGRETWKGYGEELSLENFSMTIEELGHGFNPGGIMETQRVPYNLLDIGKKELAKWFRDKLSHLIFNHLAGVASWEIKPGYTFAQNPVQPDAGHHIRVGGKATEALMTASDEMTLPAINAAAQRAAFPNQVTYPGQRIVRPFRIMGGDYYIVYLHTYVFDRLREGYSKGDWGNLKLAAQKLQVPDAEIVFNKTIIKQSPRIPMVRSVGKGGIYRNILIGPQAGCLAFGSRHKNGMKGDGAMTFMTRTDDFDRNIEVFAGALLGMKKTKFDNSTYGDYSTIVLSSYGEELS